MDVGMMLDWEGSCERMDVELEEKNLEPQNDE